MSSKDTSGKWRRFWNTATTVLLSVGILACLSLLASPVAAQDGTGEDNLPRYWEIHAFMMTASTILFVSAYVVLWLKYVSKIKGFQVPVLAVKVSRMWYRMHIYFGVAGVSLLVAGTVWGYIMVDWAHHGQHLRLLHSYIGAVAGCVALVPLALGFLTKWGKRHMLTIRWWHVALGLAGIVVMLVGLSSGWSLEQAGPVGIVPSASQQVVMRVQSEGKCTRAQTPFFSFLASSSLWS